MNAVATPVQQNEATNSAPSVESFEQMNKTSTAMKAYRTEQRVTPNGVIHLNALPFAEGELVEIIVLQRSKDRESPGKRVSLAGSVKKYINPTEPVAADTWEANSTARPQ